MAHAGAQRTSAVGNYLGHPICRTIQSHDTTYVFDRIAVSVDGEFPLEQLNKDELLFRPGLIYRPQY